MLAFRSWMMFAKRVALFGQGEPETICNKLQLVLSEEFPRIKDMAMLAAQMRNEVVMITNGDIVIDPAIMRIEAKIRNGGMRCASSRRWHFDPERVPESFQEATLTDFEGRDDRGRDVFIGNNDVWRTVAKEIPDKYRIGNPQWDAFMTDKFREHWNERFIDFTGLRICYHPRHGDRRQPYAEQIAKS